MTKNVRFPNKNVSISCHCEAAGRPWQSESCRYGIPERSTGAQNEKLPRFQFVPEGHHHCVPLGRYIMRPSGRISYAQHILYSHELYSITASAVLRFGMPCLWLKDCRVGRTRPPRNDKIGGFCGEMGRFANSKVWNFPQGDTASALLRKRHFTRTQVAFHMRSIFHLLKEQISLRGAKKPGTDTVPGFLLNRPRSAASRPERR